MRPKRGTTSPFEPPPFFRSNFLGGFYFYFIFFFLVGKPNLFPKKIK